jgi:hypothetical protein
VQSSLRGNHRRLGKALIVGSHLSGGERGDGVTIRDSQLGRHGWAGLAASVHFSFPFFSSFFFFFYIFLIILYLLHFNPKSIQINF